MKLYDDLIEEILSLLSKYKQAKLDFKDSKWSYSDENAIIFKSDAAYELGSGSTTGISSSILTSDSKYVNDDEVILIGDDLAKLKKDSPYARITLVKTSDEELGSGNRLYANIRKIDYTRYHINIEGIMMLISVLGEKESIRVSKKAIKSKISFSDVGKLMIDKYKENKSVLNVKIIFITDPSFLYNELLQAFRKCEDITKALDHLVNKVNMDCHSCSLQKICESVEELCKEDFKDK